MVAEAAERTGKMPCPACGHDDSKTIDSRGSMGDSIRRRRQCLKCRWRWTTYEMDEQERNDLRETKRLFGGLDAQKRAEIAAKVQLCDQMIAAVRTSIRSG